ncbi:MAG: FGGY-family carbohydrate kinase, partial [Terricaulis sp.]
IGLTRDSRLEHIVRAGLEAVAYQTADLLDALRADGAPKIESLLIDGGLTANAWAMQFLADICDVEVARPKFQEVTALGAARLAASGAGLIALDSATAPTSAHWTPRMSAAEREMLRSGWRGAVSATLAAAKAA